MTVSPGPVIVSVGTVAVVGPLLYAAPEVRTLLEAVLEGPAELVEAVAVTGQWLVTFVAVLIAHWGFEPLLAAVVGTQGVSDVGFALIALLPLCVIASRLHGALDPLSDSLRSVVLGSLGERVADRRGEADSCRRNGVVHNRFIGDSRIWIAGA